MAPILLASLAGIAVLAYAFSGSGADKYTANGRTWLVRKVKSTPEKSVYTVSAPAKAFGPHQEMPVIQFYVLHPSNTRRLDGKFPGVPSTISDMAAMDFGIAEG